MNDAVEYEFGLDRERHIRTAHTLLGAALTAVALLWNEAAALRREDDEFIRNPGLIEVRRGIQQDLDAFASSVTQESRLRGVAFAFLESCYGPCSDLISHPHYGEYTQNTIDRYRELQSVVVQLESQA